jgi:hypothetical protein
MDNPYALHEWSTHHREERSRGARGRYFPGGSKRGIKPHAGLPRPGRTWKGVLSSLLGAEAVE